MKIQAKYLKTVFDICSRINPDIYIYQDKNALIFQALHEGMVSLFEYTIKTEIKKSDKIITFPINKIKNILSILGEKDFLELTISEEYINFTFKDIKRKIRLNVGENERFIFPDEKKDKDERLIFENELLVSIDDFTKPLIASSDIISHINILYINEKFQIKKENDTETDSFIATVKITPIKNKEQVDNKYDFNLIYDIISKMQNKINIKLNNNSPIKFTIENVEDTTIKYMVAPIISVTKTKQEDIEEE